ncbi:N-acetyltransferase [Streptomyces lavendulae]|uniref:GNAT family N-acetyltransferase n=1 Tax=Streptomyces lavendulae TaxID=1914 RepID=UPI0031E8B7C3
MSISVVRGPAQRKAFIRLPYRLYDGDACWMPPLEKELRALLDPRRNPFFDTGSVELFLARRQGKPVGRVAAVHNPRHNTHHGTTDGFFGLFECDNDPLAADALFHAAGQWLRGRGLISMTGPVAFTIHDECGTLVDGFGSPPAILMPYNPPYHDQLLHSCGFTKAKDLWAWEWSTETDMGPAIERIARRAQQRHDVQVRPLNMADFEAETGRIWDIYTASWEQNWGFTPPSEREFRYLAAQLRQIIRPELALIAEVRGDPAAFALTVPDANQALKAARGRLTSFGLPLGLLRAARAARHIDRARTFALGVKAAYRGQGLDALLYTCTNRAGRELGYSTGELSWVLEDNTAMNAALARMGAQHSKTYRLYQRPL